MTFLSWLRSVLQSRPAKDAEAGISMLDEYVTERLGPRPPALDPTRNFADATLTSGLAPAALPDLEMDVRRLELASARLPPLWALTLALPVPPLVETIAGNGVFQECGVPSPDSWLFAAMNTMFLIGITALTVRTATTTTAADGTSVPGRSPYFTPSLGLYLLLAAAITIVRKNSLSQDETGESVQYATTLLLLLGSIAPAWMSEWLLRVRRQARQLSAELASVRRERERLRRTQETSVTTAVRRAKDLDAWERRAEILRARYRHEQALTHARTKGD